MVSSVIESITEIVPLGWIFPILSFFMMVPCGWIMQIFKTRSVRLVYSLLLGLIFQYLVFGSSMYHVFLSAVVNLLIVRNLKKNVGRYATIYNFTHNGFIHLYRLLFDYENWTIEISIIFMMTICKLCAFAYSCEDGMDRNLENNANHIGDKATDDDKNKFTIKEFTNFEYFCYVYFFPTAICGPFIEFSDFRNFINLKEEYTKIPSTILPSLKRLSHAVLFIGIYLAFKSYADVDKIIDVDGQYTLMEKCFFFVCGILHQYKYIAGFCFSEACVIASGFGYNGEKGIVPIQSNLTKSHEEHDTWGKVRCVSFLKLVSVYNPTSFFHYWNISVHTYLKRYIFSRLLPVNANFAQRQMASSRTFFVSALWHGFHPMYFLVFTHFFFYTSIDRQIKGILSILKWDKIPGENILLIMLRIIILFFLVPYHCLMFVCLDHNKLYLFLKTVYFCGLYLAVVSNIFLYVISCVLRKMRRREVKKD